MKIKSLILIAALTLACTFGSSAQTNTLFVKGNLNIKYNTRQSPGVKGIQDSYDINLNVANSVLFHGDMTDRPQIIEGWVSKAVTQARSLKYDVSCDIVNPSNPTQVKKNVSKLMGFVNIASSGEYNYSGGLGFSVLDRMAGSDSKFSGVAAGKPLSRPANWLENLKCNTVNITRNVNGKTMTVALNQYDKMEFRSVVLAAGPIPRYTDSTINGEMLYDYKKNTWFFNNVTVNYSTKSASGEGIIKSDRITGTIRWVEDEQRKVNGRGEYQFDVRVNEPMVTETSAFVSSTTDESAFFANDASAPGLSGTMKYQDTLKGETTMASAVSIDLVGNSISKEQLMILTKMIIFTAVIPMNAD